MDLRVLTTAMATLAVIGGCSSASAPSADASKKSVVSIKAANASELKIGKDLPVIAELPTTFGERDVFFDGFADNRTLYGSMSLPEPPSDRIPGHIESRSYPFLYDLDTKKITLLDKSSRSVPPYVANTVASAETVVWVEGHGAGFGSSDVEIRSYDRRTRAVTKLGRFTDKSDQSVYGDDLVVHEGFAYFSTRALPSNKGKKSAIHAVPLDGSQPLKVVVPGAEQITLNGNSLTYAQQDTQKSLDLTTKEVAVVPAHRLAADAGFCGSGETKATEYWCVGEPAVYEGENLVANPVLTFKQSTDRTTTFTSEGAGADQNYPTPEDVGDYGSWIAVTVSGGDWPAPQYLLDLDRGAARVMATDTMLTGTLPGSNLAIVTEVAQEGRTPQRVVELPHG